MFHPIRHWLCTVVASSLGLFALPAYAQPVEVTVWDLPNNEAYTGWWRAHVEKFNQENPDIRVTWEVYEPEAYFARIAAALSAGTTPDIFWAARPNGMQAVKDGQARRLDDLLDTSRFTDAAVAACTVDGQVVCLPMFLAPMLIYYNKEHFSRAGIDPSTWANPIQPTEAEYNAALEKLKAAGIVPIALGNAEGWPANVYLFAYQARYGGANELASAVFGPGTFSESVSFRQAAEDLVAMGETDYLPFGYGGIGGGQKYSLFTAGHAAMAFQGPWLLGRIQTEAAPDFEFGFFNFPSIEGGLADATNDVLGVYESLFVSAQLDHPEAVGRFLNSFSEPEAAQSFMLETDYLSAITSALEQVSGDNTTLGKTAEIVSHAKHVIPWGDQYLPGPLHEASVRLSQPLMEGSMSVDEYLAAMDAAAVR